MSDKNVVDLLNPPVGCIKIHDASKSVVDEVLAAPINVEPSKASEALNVVAAGQAGPPTKMKRFRYDSNGFVEDSDGDFTADDRSPRFCPIPEEERKRRRQWSPTRP